MTDIPPITVGHLKEIWKQNNVSDDDTIAFYFTTKEYDPITDKYGETIEIEFDQLYKREFGILMDFVPAELEEDEEEYPEPTDQEMMAAFGTKWHDGL